MFKFRNYLVNIFSVRLPKFKFVLYLNYLQFFLRHIAIIYRFVQTFLIILFINV